MKACPTAILLAFATAATRLGAQSPLAVPDVRLLLIAAIDAPDGRAQGLLTGDAAAAITRRFKGTPPIHLEVTTLRRYVQPGCSRLNVRVWQDGVQLPGAPAPRRQTIDIGINYCRDGQPPRVLD